MSSQENKQIVRRACQEANPKLLELSFGCEVIFDKEKGIIVQKNDDDNYVIWGEVSLATVSRKKIEILGHEPTLADVLLAIGDKAFDIRGKIFQESNIEYLIRELWNLSLPFSEQSDATFEFISNLLK